MVDLIVWNESWTILGLLPHRVFWVLWWIFFPGEWSPCPVRLKDRITPHVTNFFRLRLTIEKQEGKRKYKSDGAVMVGEFVSMSLSLHPSIYLSLSLSLSLYLSIYRSIYLSIDLSIYLSICQTCQADVNMQPAGQKCQLKHGRETNGVSHVYQTCEADAKKGHLKAKNASKNMTGRRKLPIEQSIYLPIYLSMHLSMHPSMHPSIYVSISPSIHLSMSLSLSLSLSPYLSIYRSIYLSVKLARPTWTCNLQVKNAS